MDPDEQTPEQPEQEDQTEEVEDPEGAEDLGDPGKRALEAMKEKMKESQRQTRELRTELEQLRAAAEDADKTPDEVALDQARREARDEATAASNKRIIRSEVKAAAGSKLADPADAVRLLDLDEFEVDGDGDVDESAIAEAIDELLKKKPYLAAQGGTVQFDSARGKPKLAGQLTKSDISTMSPDQIEKARKEGRLKNLMGTS